MTFPLDQIMGNDAVMEHPLWRLFCFERDSAQLHHTRSISFNLVFLKLTTGTGITWFDVHFFLCLF